MISPRSRPASVSWRIAPPASELIVADKSNNENSVRKRADVLLVERGLFESRARARAAIEAGGVTADGKPVEKASDLIAADAALSAQPAHPYVSRGGVKLAGALEQYPIEIEDHVIDRRLHRGAAGQWRQPRV